MSDALVAAALRSNFRLVVIEAPAGCGKTFQGAEYARELASNVAPGRILILTHTHAACSVFAERTRNSGSRVEIRTLDSLIGEIGTAYHLSLSLPLDTASWARRRGNTGFSELAAKVALLVQSCPMIANAIVQRYPLIICDEHQDSSVDQHAIIMAFHDAGARLRIFGDPMQRIYAKKGRSAFLKDEQRWADLCKKADSSEVLDTPHRWAAENRELGEWICGAREALRSTGKIDLRGALPRGVQITFADNRSSRHGGYQITKEERGPIDAFVRSQTSLLILTAHNDTIRSLRAFFGRRLPIWEGHTRDAMNSLVETVQTSKGNAVAIAGALSGFLFKISRGFTPASYGRILLKEVESQCSGRRRGKPATLQALARLMLDAPNHIGVSQVLRRLEELTRTDPAFRDIKIDLYREFWEAVRLADFDDPEEGLAEITRRRSRAQVGPPRKAISTVHKAKGLECDSVLIMPCDDKQFSEANRCLLYVALSRAKKSLQIVVSRQNPSPLLELP